MTNNILDYHVLKSYDLWLWDFDETLIDTATYYYKSMDSNDILKRTDNELNTEIPGWKYYIKLIKHLVKNGKRVGIVSFGTYRIIQAYMDRIFGMNQKYFTKNNILTICRDNHDKPTQDMPKNKNGFIHKLMNYYRINNYKRIIFFDDNINNVADASVLGITSVRIPGKHATYVAGIISLFDKKTMTRVAYELKKGCDRNQFSSIGSRKAGLMDKLRNVKKGKILEGFGCPCDANYWRFFFIMIIALFVFWLCKKMIR